MNLDIQREQASRRVLKNPRPKRCATWSYVKVLPPDDVTSVPVDEFVLADRTQVQIRLKLSGGRSRFACVAAAGGE
ncbi:MAG TPA: hypothetical protein VHG93_10110 [Longimicrobium sp.]|nr:hypothetical protein [Longimicrobium sp.]